MVHEFVLAAESNDVDTVARLLTEGADVHMEMDRAVRYCTNHAMLEVLAYHGADLLAFGFQPINIVSTEDAQRAEILVKYHPQLLTHLTRSTKIASHFIKMHPSHIIQIISETTSPSHVYDSLISVGYDDPEGWRILARRAGKWNDWETFKKIPKEHHVGMHIEDVSGDARILTTLLDDGRLSIDAGLYEYLMRHGYTEFLSVILERNGYMNFKPSKDALTGIIIRGHYPSICLYLFSEVSWNGWLSKFVDEETTKLIALRMSRYGVSKTAKGTIVDSHWMEGLRVSRKMVYEGMPWAFTRDLHMDPVPEKMKYTDRLSDISIVTCEGSGGNEPRRTTPRHHAKDPLTTEMLMRAYGIITQDVADVYARINAPLQTTVEPSPIIKRKRDN